MFVRELRVTYEQRQDLPAFDTWQILSAAKEAAAYLNPILRNEPVEIFVVVCLSTEHRVLGYREVADLLARLGIVVERVWIGIC